MRGRSGIKQETPPYQPQVELIQL